MKIYVVPSTNWECVSLVRLLTKTKNTPITDTPQYFNPFYALLKNAYIDQHMTVLGETYLVGGLDQYNWVIKAELFVFS